MLSILSLGLINALSGLREIFVFSPFPFTDIGFANISELATFTLHFPPEISVKGKGEKTKISLRPERALINPNDKMDNIHSGKIEEVIYHGDHTRVRINLLGNDQFILKVPNSSANMDIKLGKDIKIGWNSDDARALDPK